MKTTCQPLLLLMLVILQKLRHIQKHDRISFGEVHELCQHKDMKLQHIETDKQKGDLMTKGLARPKHEPAMRMVGLYSIILYPG